MFKRKNTESLVKRPADYQSAEPRTEGARGAGKLLNAHGFKRVKRRVMLNGLDAIDSRNLAARGLLRWKDEIQQALGGEDISPQRATILEMAMRTKALVDHVDGFLLEAPNHVLNRRKKSLRPIVMQRQILCDSLTRMLTQMGVDRVEKAVPDLQQYLRDKAAGVVQDVEPEESESEEAAS